MKINKSFRLSEEAVEILEAQPNATEFVENLILGKVERPVPWLELEYRIDKIMKKLEETPQLQPVIRSDSRVPMTPDNPSQLTVLPCCLSTTPCKHWSFDGVTDEWTNSITGETRNV